MKNIVKILIKEFKGKTMIFSTNNHDIWTECDYIHILKSGKVVESGTYYDLFEKQDKPKKEKQ